MTAYRYYSDESLRWRKTLRAEALPAEAREAVEEIAAQRDRPIEIRFRDRGRGLGSTTGWIQLPRRALNWLLVAHEVAHVFVLKHNNEHAAEVEHVLRDLAALGWARHEIECDLRRHARERAAAGRRAARETARDPRAELIERRYKQIAQLDRKIRSLTTRRKTAQRSLHALARAQKGGAS